MASRLLLEAVVAEILFLECVVDSKLLFEDVVAKRLFFVEVLAGRLFEGVEWRLSLDVLSFFENSGNDKLALTPSILKKWISKNLKF